MATVDATEQSQFTILGSAARTATPTVDTFRVGRARSLVVVIDVTAASATPSVTVTVKGVDEVTGVTWDLLASSPITGTGTTVLQIDPALTAAAGTKAAEVVPNAVTVTAVHADADSITYSVTAHVA